MCCLLCTQDRVAILKYGRDERRGEELAIHVMPISNHMHASGTKVQAPRQVYISLHIFSFDPLKTLMFFQRTQAGMMMAHIEPLNCAGATCTFEKRIMPYHVIVGSPLDCWSQLKVVCSHTCVCHTYVDAYVCVRVLIQNLQQV